MWPSEENSFGGTGDGITNDEENGGTGTTGVSADQGDGGARTGVGYGEAPADPEIDRAVERMSVDQAEGGTGGKGGTGEMRRGRLAATARSDANKQTHCTVNCRGCSP